MLPSESPTKAGYNVAKWVSAKHGDNHLEYGYFIDGNDTFTAVWEIAWYTLTYNLNDADAPESIESQEGQATTNILLSEIVPTKEGFTFVRWENTAGEKFQPGEPYFFGYHDDTLTAVWGYTVTLDAKGGECVNFVNGGVGETLDVVPTKEGYTLFGWQRPNGDICNPYTFDFGHESLEAIWGFSITYDTKNGNESFPTQVVLPGAMFTIPETIPTKNGYNFEFWTTNPQDPYSGNQYFPGNTVTCYENTVLYAAWTSGVMFDANGGSCDAFLYTGFDTDVYEIPTATREGCTLMKWVNSQGVEFAPNGSYPFIYGNDTLTAIWGYTVTLNANGGECEATTVTKPVGETLDIVPTKEGLNFLRWTNSEGLTFDASNPYTFVYGNDTLTAVWGYTVTYLNYDGTVFETEDALEGESVTVTENAPERFDHVFMYWVISETEKITIPGRELNMSRNVTLVPQWKEMYVIAFWADEDELFEVGDKLQGTDYEISFFAPAKDGYEFFCWKSRAHNEYYYPGEVYKRDEAMGFDAIWVENGKKKIVYSMGDVDGNFYEQDADVNAPIAIYTATPTKEGCTFNGWIVKEVPVEPTESVQTYSLMRTASSNISNGQYVGEDSAILIPDMTGSFTIEYLGRDGSVIYTRNKPFGGSIILYGTGLTSGEYELAHWYDMDNPDNIYYPGGDFSLDKDMCFGSTWLPASNFIGVNIFNKPENNTLYIGENHRLNAVATPPYLTAKCTWEVDNENIATIDKNGVITPKAEGTITVIVEANESGNDDVYHYDSCVLEVKKHIFDFAENIDINDKKVKRKALVKMDEYYLDEENELKSWIDKGDTCIFAFEGLGDPSLKEDDGDVTNVSAEHPIWMYNAMMVVTKGKEIKYVTRRASTLPDDATGPNDKDKNWRTIGPTTLKEGIYGYRTGNHGGKYVGMRPTDDPRKSWYYKTSKFYCADSEVTNLHAGYHSFFNNSKNSAGCQLVHYKDYISFGKAVGFLDATNSSLTDISHIYSIPLELGFGGIIGNKTGLVGGGKSVDITVKYIIDRTYDNQNPYKGDSVYADEKYGDNSSSYPNGIFYPLEHTHNDLCEI